MASARAALEENLVRARAHYKHCDIVRTEAVIGWIDRLKVNFKGKTLMVDTGLIDAQQFFTVMVEPLSDVLEMF